MEKKNRRVGIYLLPNLFTTISLFLGFLAIVSGIKGHFSSGAIAILVAMIADALDGRIARITNSQSDFGAQYDSISDMVAFGLAPSLVMYEWSLSQLGKLGWLIAFLYTACTALRLARFNTQILNIDKKYFQGLACTAAAGVMASGIWVGHYYGSADYLIAVLSAILTALISIFMVSNIRYRSFKEFDARGRIPFINLIIIVLLLTAIAFDPPTVLFLIFLGYALSGPLQTLWTLRKAKLRHSRRIVK